MKGFLQLTVVLMSFCLVSFLGYLIYEGKVMDYQPRVTLASALTESQRDEVLKYLINSEVILTDLDGLKQHLEQISWIHRVYIARKWPRDIVLDIRVNKAIAYWNNNGFINRDGEVFFTDLIVGGQLPQLYGPENSAYRVMSEYQQLNGILFRAGRSIEILTLNERGEWEFQDYSGIRVLLGKENIRQRLDRSIAVMQEVTNRNNGQRIARVDARYNNGVAIGWLQNMELAKLQREVN